MSYSINMNDQHRPLPKNTLKNPPNRNVNEKEDQEIPTDHLLLIALGKIFRWKSVIILITYFARKMGISLYKKNHLEQLQNRLYHKLENFFG